jgi:hypothetical protein
MELSQFLAMREVLPPFEKDGNIVTARAQAPKRTADDGLRAGLPVVIEPLS